MWYFLRFRAFIPELSLPKVALNIDKIFQKMSVSKKLTFFQKNLLYQNLLRGFFKPNLETSLGRNKQKQIFWANVSFFWRLVIFVTDRKFQSRVSLSSDNSGFKALNLTFLESSGRQLSHGTPQNRSYHWETWRKMQKSKKTPDFAFFVVRSEKSGWPAIGHLWRYTTTT